MCRKMCGKCLGEMSGGNVWGMCGKCVGNVLENVWEMSGGNVWGKCVGNVREMCGESVRKAPPTSP